MFANPTGGVVTGGSATISNPASNITQINQASDRAVIDWNTYNIAQHEQVNYQQPSSSSIILNRVNPANGVSSIFGQIRANGQVWIVNPAGIWFAPGSYVDVSGLLATTANISNHDFMSGQYRFIQDPYWQGAIINQGDIIIRNAGLGALIGVGVVNDGRIIANMGTIVLGSATAYIVDFTGDQLIHFAVGSVESPALDQMGERLTDAVRNSGTIIANGGQILMSAQSASQVLDNAINMDGIAVANSASQKNGAIVLMGGDQGLVRVSGKLEASGKESGEQGGVVKVLGKQVALTDNASIDVSGDAGGGTVLVGGNALGLGLEPNAEYSFLGSDAIINASALTQGNGGKVVVWSNEGTYFYGNIYAQGGRLGGDGGWVETSGKAYLEAMGNVHADAPFGQAGMWLLDPFNVTIQAAATTNGSFSSGVFTPSGNNAVFNVSTLNGALNSGTSVTITTGSSGAQNGDITLAAGGGNAISKTAGGDATLTMTAARNIILSSTITSTSNLLNLVLNGQNITINNNAAINTNNGSFTSTATQATSIANNINTGSGSISLSLGAGSALTINNNASLFSTGNIGILADTLTWSSASTQIGGSSAGAGYANNVSIAPKTSGQAISIAGSTGAGVLSATNLNKIRTNTLHIGNSTSGAITFANPWTATANVFPAGTGTLIFENNGSITQSTSQPLNIGSGRSLIIKSTGIVTLNSPNNVFSYLAAIANGGINIRNNSFSALTVTTLQGDLASPIAGIDTSAGNGNVLIMTSTPGFNLTTGASIKSGTGTIFIDIGGGPGNFNLGELNTTNTTSSAVTIQNASSLALGTINTAGTVNLGQTGFQITGATTQNVGGKINSNFLTANTTGLINLNSSLNTIANLGVISRGGAFTLNNTGSLTLTGTNTLAQGTTTNAVTINTTGALTLNSGSKITGNTTGDAIVLVTSQFINNAGSTALTPGSGGRFLVWSANPSLDTRGGLAYSFKQYNAVYGSTTPAGSSSGFLYSIAPVVTPVLSGTINKVYDGTTQAILNAGNYSLTGLIDGDLVTYTTPFIGNYANKNAGTGKSVTATGVSFGTPTDSTGTATVYGYQFNTTASGSSGSISQAPLTVTAQTDTKTYDGTTSSSVAPIVGTLFAGDSILTNAIQTFDTKNVGINNKTLTASGLVINDGNSGGNYNVSYVSNGNGSITPATLTYIANSASRIYGDANPLFSGSVSGFVAGENLGNATTGSLAFTSLANLNSSVGSYAIDGSGLSANNGNYVFTQAAGNANALTITQRPVDISGTKIYDGTVNFLGSQLIAGNLVVGDTVTLGGSATVNSKNVANYNSLVSNLLTSSNSNYKVTGGGVNISITPAPLTITANNQSKIYGQAFNFAGNEFLASGLQNTDAIDSVSLASAGAPATAPVGSGSYAINISNAIGNAFDANNYNITYTNGTLTVNRAALTVTADNQSKTYGQAFNFAGNEFQANGLQNADAIDSVSLSSAGAAATASVGGSPYTINISNALGNTFDANNYNITYTNGSLTVGRAALTVTADNQSKTYGQVFNFAGNEFQANGLQNADAIDSVSLSSAGAAATASVGGSPYTINISNALGNTFDANNYNISYVNGSLSVGRAALTVTADNQSKTYGQAFNFAGNEFQANGLQNADAIDSVSLSSAGTAATASVGGSPYTINISNALGNTFDANNYNISYVNGSLTVSPASLTITNVTANNKIYDGTKTATLNTITAGLSGLIAGDSVNLIDSSVSALFATKNAGNAISITASGFAISGSDASNYVLLQPTGLTADITPASIIVSGISANNKVYDGSSATSLDLTNAFFPLLPPGESVHVDPNGYMANFIQINPGVAIPVDVNNLGLLGEDAGNYILMQPTGLTADITKPEPIIPPQPINSVRAINYGIIFPTDFSESWDNANDQQTALSAKLTSFNQPSFLKPKSMSNNCISLGSNIFICGFKSAPTQMTNASE